MATIVLAEPTSRRLQSRGHGDCPWAFRTCSQTNKKERYCLSRPRTSCSRVDSTRSIAHCAVEDPSYQYRSASVVRVFFLRLNLVFPLPTPIFLCSSISRAKSQSKSKSRPRYLQSGRIATFPFEFLCEPLPPPHSVTSKTRPVHLEALRSIYPRCSNSHSLGLCCDFRTSSNLSLSALFSSCILLFEWALLGHSRPGH